LLTSNSSADMPSASCHSKVCSNDAIVNSTTRSAMGRPLRENQYLPCVSIFFRAHFFGPTAKRRIFSGARHTKTPGKKIVCRAFLYRRSAKK
jgi:hypothetical protein